MKTQDFLLILPTTPLEQVIDQANEVLQQNQWTINADGQSLYQLHDWDQENSFEFFEATYISDATKDFECLKKHPSGGWMNYSYKNHRILVSFQNTDCKNKTQATISFYISKEVYYKFKEDIKTIMGELHRNLNAEKTVGGWMYLDEVDLEEGFCFKEQINKKLSFELSA